MASVFGHALVGGTLSKVLDRKSSRIVLLCAILSSMLPDVDVLSFKLGYAYEHWLGHRGVTHSVLFAVVWAMLLSVVFGGAKKLLFFTIVFLATLSHGVLDAMTNGGLGVGFFIPFETTRHFFCYRPIQVSPIGVERFFSEWGMKVVLSEVIWIGLPCMVVLIINRIAKKNNFE
ncbi:MAG: metal-dependent hydrolase [Flavobacteriaceae bacterium]